MDRGGGGGLLDGARTKEIRRKVDSLFEKGLLQVENVQVVQIISRLGDLQSVVKLPNPVTFLLQKTMIYYFDENEN